MLARVLAMARVCLSVCLCPSVTSRSSIETAKRIGLFLAWELPSTYPTLGTSLWNFFAPNSGLEKFHHDRSIVEMYYQLSSTKVDAQSVINWTVAGQLS